MAGSDQTTADSAAADRNASTIATYHNALWRDGDKSAIDTYWHPDAEVHMTDFSDTAVDVVKADVERYFSAFTDIETTIEHLVAAGDRVVLHWTTSGRHVGAYGDIASTGKRITMSGMDLLKLENDRIIACWSMWDGLSVYDQLGALKIG